MQVQLTPEIKVNLRKNALSRNLKITINHHGKVTLTMPRYIPFIAGKLFLKEKQAWVIDKVGSLHKKTKASTEQKETARAKLTALALSYAQFYGLAFRRIAIRDQASVWGSCSRQGNLNFNWRLILAPEEIQKYVVVHELCHLIEMNHSPRFWAQVAKTIPNYKDCRRWLKTQGKHLY